MKAAEDEEGNCVRAEMARHDPTWELQSTYCSDETSIIEAKFYL